MAGIAAHTPSHHGAGAVTTTSTIAGGTGGADPYGFADGPSEVALFISPLDVVVGEDGTRFITDSLNHCVRSLNVDGTVATIAGIPGTKGGDDGPGASATFYCPAGITMGSDGALYVTENKGGRIRRLVAPDGVDEFGEWMVTTVLRGLATPWGITADGAGNLLVAESDNHRVVRVPERGGALTVIAGDGTEGHRDGPAESARFSSPAGIAIDSRTGDLIVAEWTGNRVRRITALGSGREAVVDTLAGTGAKGRVDGPGASAKFNEPAGVAVDCVGTVVVTEWSGNAVRMLAPTADRTVTTVAGTGTRGFRDGTAAQFHRLGGCTIDKDGSLLVCDCEVRSTRKRSQLHFCTSKAATNSCQNFFLNFPTCHVPYTPPHAHSTFDSHCATYRRAEPSHPLRSWYRSQHAGSAKCFKEHSSKPAPLR